MENGALNGAVHTNHDRDPDKDVDSIANMNGTGSGRDANGGQVDGAVGSSSANMVNGNNNDGIKNNGGREQDEGAAPAFAPAGAQLASTQSARMNDLPDAIQHITSNFVPLGFLLRRLAQKTHNNLQDMVRELARKPVAGMTMNGGGAAAVGASGSPLMPGAEDGSVENIEKKKALLDFARSEHANWVKALVIAEWSKKATQISKLIDLENHMFEEELVKYEQAVFTMLNLKRNLNAARVPSPDLKTALQVLSQGTAPWMPDLGFLAPPPLTPDEKLKWLDDISTLLSLRLNLDDHDNIPYHFRDYTIASGRVTFTVPGEFAVDLTLGSDDFSEQLWFLDLRFLFAPASADLTPGLRKALEDRVNSVLATEGLVGCYRCLHEYVLTHQINELRRQALELGRGRWVETLRVEQLNRAVSVQYWTSRAAAAAAAAAATTTTTTAPPPPTSSNTAAAAGLKSWFIIGVHSGRDAARPVPEEQVTSRLGLRWFRDNKEVKDVDVAFLTGLGLGPSAEDARDAADATATATATTLSAERIVQTIVALHIAHILTGIHAKLLAKPLFVKRRAAVCLRTSKTDPSASSLTVQLTHRDRICIRIDPVTGLFALAPPSRIAASSEYRINSTVAASGKDPVDEGFAMLDSLRCLSLQDDLSRRAKSYGWSVVRNNAGVVKPDELRQVVNLRDTYQVLWLTRPDWAPLWYLLASFSLSGDRWWLVKLNNNDSGARIETKIPLPVGESPTDVNDTFFSDLTVFATGLIAQYTDARELRRRNNTAKAARVANPYLPALAKLPALSLRLSELLASSSSNGDGDKPAGRRSAWALDFVQLLFRGVDVDSFSTERARRIGVLAEARLTVTDRAKFRLLGGSSSSSGGGGGRAGADHDVAFNARTGQFCLYLRAQVGESIIETLVSRLRALERLVGFLDAIRRENRVVRCETVTLRKLVFSYGAASSGGSDDGTHRRWKVAVDLAKATAVRLQLERGCPHLRVVDYLNRVANDPATFAAVPFFLATTLSLHQALDRMEDAWGAIQMRNGGLLGIFPRALDWVVVRFFVRGPHGRARQLVIEIRLKTRHGASLWQVRRLESGTEQQSQSQAPEDELNKAMVRIFSNSGPGWRGLLTAIVASPWPVAANGDGGEGGNSSSSSTTDGIGNCLALIDESVRAMLAVPPPTTTLSVTQMQQRRAQAAQAQAQAQAQATQQQQQQQQQQPPLPPGPPQLTNPGPQAQTAWMA
ncbi:RNA polymerase 2 holoenzyme mediator complex component [Niveomyces insectorum RCEF 264]|uniref:Mediator of RNA polymerase II transcription subunit 14 n=1 Tax=Niveomyces insectorum RCEF 264 TaxID=1081102 RepID=A0A167TW21_9HYPO|nr:RNA polymerase 2 holoenzyme mediator complex component [Niveomyces insectorum RCEF 264]